MIRKGEAFRKAQIAPVRNSEKSQLVAVIYEFSFLDASFRFGGIYHRRQPHQRGRRIRVVDGHHQRTFRMRTGATGGGVTLSKFSLILSLRLLFFSSLSC